MGGLNRFILKRPVIMDPSGSEILINTQPRDSNSATFELSFVSYKFD
jgi:hypothetical protein